MSDQKKCNMQLFYTTGVLFLKGCRWTGFSSKDQVRSCYFKHIEIKFLPKHYTSVTLVETQTLY